MRKLYKVLSWDHSNNKGVATDGTKYEDQLITYRILGIDLDPEQNGFLVPNEVISAQETANRYLFDIFIEEGPRAIRPAEEATAAQVGATDTEIEAAVNAQLDSYTAEIIGKQSTLPFGTRPHFLLWDDDMAINIEQRLRNLEAKVQKLERASDTVDDHR